MHVAYSIQTSTCSSAGSITATWNTFGLSNGHSEMTNHDPLFEVRVTVLTARGQGYWNLELRRNKSSLQNAICLHKDFQTQIPPIQLQLLWNGVKGPK